MRRIPQLLLLVSCLLANMTAFSEPAPLQPTPLNIGDLAPDFSLAGSDGATHTLSDLRGQYVVVAFFPKAFTQG